MSLPKLVELKRASGMTNPGHLKDLSDAQELARALSLDAAFAERLDPFVGERFLELLRGLEADRR